MVVEEEVLSLAFSFSDGVYVGWLAGTGRENTPGERNTMAKRER